MGGGGDVLCSRSWKTKLFNPRITKENYINAKTFDLVYVLQTFNLLYPWRKVRDT